ncbi:MAG: alpha/beta hydrolase [Muribaculaceae bacterium]
MKLKLNLLLCALSVLLSMPLAAQDASINQVDTIAVKSEKMNKMIKNVVIVPAQYHDVELQNEQYPVLYLLHGYGGNYASWIKIKPELDDLASEYGIIIVCPDGATSWYFDSPVDKSICYETYVAKELIDYIDNNYRTIPEAKMRAITGLSMGGHGGLWLGLRHPDVFGSCGSTSGGVDFRPFPKKWKIRLDLGEYAENKAVWDSHTVLSLVPSIDKDAAQHIIIDCGYDDFFFEVNNNLHAELLKAGIPHDYIVRPGKHNAPYWNNSIDYQILFFVKAFQGN